MGSTRPRRVISPVMAMLDFTGTRVSADRRTAAVVLQMTSDVDAPALRRQTVAQLRNIVDQVAGDYPALEIILTGPYVTMFEMFEYVRQDLALFSIFVALLMLAVLYLLIGGGEGDDETEN